MHNPNPQQSGFSLVELMIAMVLALVLILGVSTVFVSIKSTASNSSQLKNTQQVLRFVNSILKRAVHRADAMDVSGDSSALILGYDLDNLANGETYTSCLGTAYNSAFYETYLLDGTQLKCAQYTDAADVDSSGTVEDDEKTFTPIGTNIDALSFAKNNDLLTVTITAADETNPVSMMFAQRQAILDLNL
jgi:prepilin-type N-terminal cleavage/methylation domain-containing protein